MSTETPSAPASSPPSPSRVVRVEYVDFQDVGEHREFRLRARGMDGSSEVRVRIAVAAFSTGRVRLQDGPDICYQKLLRTVAAGDPMSSEGITIDEADLALYTEAHANAPKTRSWSPPATVPPLGAAAASPARAAPLVASGPPPVLEGGQRVRHLVFGLGVMSAPSGRYTVVSFDKDGPRRFVTSMLEVDVLSAPHTWQAGPRGKNGPCA
jgi:hypothetical protein